MPDAKQSRYPDKLGGAPHSKQSLRLWLRLLSCSIVIEKRVRTRLEGEFDITLPRFDVLAVLDRHPDGLTMSALSQSLMVSNGNATGIVTRLIEDRYVARVANAEDRRVSTVRLTARGREAFAKMAADHEKWVDRMFADLSDAQIAELTTLLGRLRRSVEDNLS